MERLFTTGEMVNALSHDTSLKFSYDGQKQKLIYQDGEIIWDDGTPFILTNYMLARMWNMIIPTQKVNFIEAFKAYMMGKRVQSLVNNEIVKLGNNALFISMHGISMEQIDGMWTILD